MTTYLPPLHINQKFNSSDYDYQDQKLTLSTTEQRYLKKTGADYSYANTTFQNQVAFNNYALNCNEGLNIGSSSTSISINSTDLLFSTSSTERLRIKSTNGYIGVNKTAPSYLLDVNGTLNGTTIYENTTSLASKYSQLGVDNTFTGQNTINNNLIVTGQLKINGVIRPYATGTAYVYNLTQLNAADDTLVGRNTTDTLKNKTLFRPTIDTCFLNTAVFLDNGTNVLTANLAYVNGLTNGTTSADIATLQVSSGSTSTILTGCSYDSATQCLNILNNLAVNGYLKVTSIRTSTGSNSYSLTTLTANDYLVGRNTTDTLTNKALTSPTLNTSLVLDNGTTLTTATLKNVNGVTTTTTSSDIATLQTNQAMDAINITNIQAITDNLNWTSASSYIGTNSGINFSLNGNLYLFPGAYIIQTNPSGGYYSTSASNLKNLGYLDATSSIQTQFNNITSNYLTTSAAASTYAKLNNINTFTYNQNITKNIYVDDASFATINYMQLALNANGTVSGHNAVVGIDFTTWLGRGAASARIYGLDNNNYSSHLVFATAPPGSAGTLSTERMRIQDNGYIGIGKTNPSYLLDVNGNLNATTMYENATSLGSKYATITALNSYVPNNIALTSDTTNTTLYIPFTTSSATTSSASLRVNPNLKYNASTNALTATTFTGALVGNVTGDCTGSSGSCAGNSSTATTSTNIALTTDIATASVYIPFTASSATTSSAVMKINSNLKYNASTNVLTATTFTGALVGNVTGDCTGSSGSCTGNATTATTSTNIGLTTDIATASVYIPFTSSSATTSSAVMKINSNLKYNASTNALTATTFTGALVGNVTGNCTGSSGSCTGNATTATTSTNIGLTTDIATASVYIPFTSSSATTSSAVMKINSNLKYNASTNALTATTFTGALVGNVTGNCTGSSGSCTGNTSTATTASNISTNLISTGGPYNLALTTSGSSVPVVVESNLYYSSNNDTLTTGNIFTSGGNGNTFNGDTTFYNKVNVPTPTTSNTNEVVNTGYLTSVLNNYAPINNGNPTGTIITFSVQTSSLSGYLLCDGSTYSPTTYPALYVVIGTQFGGTASAPWLPDYRGSFLRGFNDGSTNMSGVSGNAAYLSSAVGTLQTDQVGSHTHGNPHANQTYGGSQRRLNYPAAGNTEQFVYGTNQFSATVNYNIPSGENRPVNFSVYYYIKT